MQIRPADIRAVARQNRIGAGAWLPCQKVTDKLGGSAVGLSGQPEGRLLNLPLPVHSGENPIAGKILRSDTDQKRGVGVLPVPGGTAHAVRDHTAGFGCGGEHLSARTHTECESAPAAREMDVKTVVRRRQYAAFPPVLRTVDHALTVLNPHSHCKGLPLHGHALAAELLKRIPGRVTDGQNGMTAGERICAGRCIHQEPGQFTVLRMQGPHPVPETDLSAERNDFFTNLPDYMDENICPDMGLCVVENGLCGTVQVKLFKNP